MIDTGRVVYNGDLRHGASWAAAGFASLYLLSYIVPLFWWKDYWAFSSYIEVSLIGQVFAILSLSLSVIYFRKWFVFDPTSTAWAALFLYCLCSSFWSIDATASLIGALTFFIFALGITGMCSGYVYNLEFTARIIIGSVFMLMIALGIDGRFIGGIAPNTQAQLAFVAAVFFCFGEKLRHWGLLICFLIILQSQGRATLIAFFVFLSFRFFIIPYSHRLNSSWITLAILVVIGVISTLFYGQLLEFVIKYLGILLQINLSERLGSNLTGRTDLWDLGLRYFYHNPIVGYGFRTRGDLSQNLGAAVNAHSAFVNLLLDLGVVGACLYVVWYFVALIQSLRFRSVMGITISAALIAIVPLLFSEPLYIGWYNPITFLMMICVFGVSALWRQAGLNR